MPVDAPVTRTTLPVRSAIDRPVLEAGMARPRGWTPHFVGPSRSPDKDWSVLRIARRALGFRTLHPSLPNAAHAPAWSHGTSLGVAHRGLDRRRWVRILLRHAPADRLPQASGRAS